MEEKKHKKEVIGQCKGLTNRSKDKKKCIKLILDCHMNKCKDETIKVNASKITEEERKQCDEKFKGDWNKAYKCNQNISKKKGFFEASAKFGHCTANKCPEAFEYIDGQVKKIIKNINKDSKIFKEIDECMQKECPKELKAIDNKPTLLQVSNECNKKYNTSSAQSTCLLKGLRPEEKARKKYRKCLQTHCKQEKDNKITKTKLTKKNSTKHSTKHSAKH